MIRNKILEKDIKSKKFIRKFSPNKQRKIREYKTITDNKKRIINIRIADEEKNLEKSLNKIKKGYSRSFGNKLRNDDQSFYEKYNDFSKTHFKSIDSIVKDISEIYINHGYIIPNLYNNLFKINPLLESNSNRIFLSCLYNPNRTKFSKTKLLNSNKSIIYLKKLTNIISPEINNKDKKKNSFILNLNKIDKKQKKIQQNAKNQTKMLTNNIQNLINLINNNKLNEIERLPTKRKSNKSVVLDNDINKSSYDQQSNRNIIIDAQSQIHSEKVITTSRRNSLNNCHNIFLKRIYKKQSTLSNFYLNKKRDDSNYTNNGMTINSTKGIETSNFQFDSNKKINNDGNKLFYLNTERINKNSKKYILSTPEIIKIKNTNKDKSNKNINSLSISNEINSLSHRTKIENSKPRESLFFKVKEFTINSTKINNSYKFNQSSGKVSRYSSSNKVKKVEKYKSEKKVSLEFNVSTPKKIFKNNDEKEEFINRIYKKINNKGYKDIENNLKLYLSQAKQLNEKEIKDIISILYNKNFNYNLQDLKKIIRDKKITKKSFRLYLNNHDFNRIEPLLKILNDEDKKIMQFDKKMVKACVQSYRDS